jgi:hypothetical protein
MRPGLSFLGKSKKVKRYDAYPPFFLGKLEDNYIADSEFKEASSGTTIYRAEKKAGPFLTPPFPKREPSD